MVGWILVIVKTLLQYPKAIIFTLSERAALTVTEIPNLKIPLEAIFVACELNTLSINPSEIESRIMECAECEKPVPKKVSSRFGTKHHQTLRILTRKIKSHLKSAKEIIRFQQHAVCWDQAAGGEQDDITWDNRFGWDRLGFPSAQHCCLEGHPRA